MSEHIIVPVDLLNALVDPDPCHFDHHGGCQAHGYISLYISLQPGEVCPEEAAKRLIADSPRIPPDRCLGPSEPVTIDRAMSILHDAAEHRGYFVESISFHVQPPHDQKATR